MEIVVEYALIDNLVINFLIIKISALLLKNNVGFSRIALASVFGAFFSLLSPILSLPLWLSISYKIILGIVMVRIGLKPLGIKKNILYFIIFILTTAMMAGACFGIIFLFSGSIQGSGVLMFGGEIPVGVIASIVACVALLVAKLINYFSRKKLFDSFIFKAEIENKGKRVNFEAYLDTGNRLYDPQTNAPVMIIEYSIFRKIFDIPIDKILTQNANSFIDNSHYIDFGTIGMSGKILVTNVEKVTLITKEKKVNLQNVTVGLSLSKFKKSFDCEALFGPEIAKDFLDKHWNSQKKLLKLQECGSVWKLATNVKECDTELSHFRNEYKGKIGKYEDDNSGELTYYIEQHDCPDATLKIPLYATLGKNLIESDCKDNEWEYAFVFDEKIKKFEMWKMGMC